MNRNMIRKWMLLVILAAGIWTTGWAQLKEPEFPYPEMPASLVSTEARLAYLCEHFWDKFDFNDASETNRLMGEQGLANFISLTQKADAKINEVAGTSMVNRMWQSKDKDYYLELTEHYLFNPESPLRNDLLYEPLLRRIVQLMPETDAQASKYAFMLRNVAKNQVGSIANDFRYIDRAGELNTLHLVNAKYTLLYLYDPDCENCQRTLMHMRAQLNDPRVQVTAIYPDSDTELWKGHRLDFKENWIDGYSPDGELGRKGLYFIQATPSLYLLDEHKRVLLKDAPLEEILRALQTLP